MINYKQILEAINKGILLALDDFDDEEQVLNIKSKQVQNRDYTKDYLDLMKDVVDLGLPSGTLWCKYNLGCNFDKLNTFPENSKPENWYGNYYAWGETETKPEFSLDNYKFSERYGGLTKYCKYSEYGLNSFTDNLTELLPEDDAAYQNKHIGNYKFYIPTKELCEELKNYTTNYWVNNYNPNKAVHHTNDRGIKRLNGRVFTSKVNGNTLFIPVAGYYIFNFAGVGSVCNMWTSSLCLNPVCAYTLHFSSDNIGISNDNRCYGFSVRPVINL